MLLVAAGSGLLTTARPSVLLTDGLSRPAVETLSQKADVVERFYSPDELAAGVLGGHEGVIIRSATTLDADAIAAGAAGKLKVIGRAGVGVDNVSTSLPLLPPSRAG